MLNPTTSRSIGFGKRLLRLSAMLISVGALCISGCKQEPNHASKDTQKIDIGSLKEYSVNLEMSDLQPILNLVSRMVSGLSSDRIDGIVQDVKSMAVKDQRDWNLSVTFTGKVVPLVVRVYLHHELEPDIYFFTAPDLAQQINDAIGKYMEALGR